MSLDKFSSKSKEDLILIATIGQVLTQEVARSMTQDELARYLSDAEVRANKPQTEPTLVTRAGRPLKKTLAVDKGRQPKQEAIESSAEEAGSVKKEKSAKPGRPARLVKPDKTAKVSKASKSARTAEPDKMMEDAEAAKSIDAIVPAVTARPGRPAKAAKADRVTKTDRAAKAEKPDMTLEAAETEEPVRTARMPKPARILKNDKTIKPDEVPEFVRMVKSDETARPVKETEADSLIKIAKIRKPIANRDEQSAAAISAASAGTVDVPAGIDNAPAPAGMPADTAQTVIDSTPAAEPLQKRRPGRKPNSSKTPAVATAEPATAAARPAAEPATAAVKPVAEPAAATPAIEPIAAVSANEIPASAYLSEEESRQPDNVDSMQSARRGRKPRFQASPSTPGDFTASIDRRPGGVRERVIDPDRHPRIREREAPAADGLKAADLPESEVSSSEGAEAHKRIRVPHIEMTETLEGVLEVMSDGYGFLRKENYLQSPRDIYIAPQYIRRFNLRTGDKITGPGKPMKENDRYQALLYIKDVNGYPPEKMMKRTTFDRLTPIYPEERFILETTRNELSTRIIDLIAPIGKGQRGMIVSPPKAGKTILLQKIANAIAVNNPGTKLIVLLIDERPEEVTDMQRSIKGEVVYSTFDKTPENHVKIVELVLERAMRLVELGEDVVILLDSITRLGRAYNLTINPTGRTLSGGLDPGALYGPKRFFGAARNIENGGSLTIIATALIDTGSRMDEVIFEEFKGTGNMEVYLDRKLSEKRIFPAIDINRSGTRREELLLTKQELDAVWTIRKAFGQLDTAAVTEMIINLLLKTGTNSQFVSSVNVSMSDKTLFDAMRGNKSGGTGNGNSGGSGSGSGNYY
ncbi:MAG: transcription termination factor Rho [Saccharofermentanales bacterium]